MKHVIWCRWLVILLLGVAGSSFAALNPEAPRPVRTPSQELTDAAASGDGTTVRRLLAQGVPVMAGAPVTGATALHQAAAGGHVSVIEVLIAAGAKVDAPDADGATPLVYAAYHGRQRAVAALLDAKADFSQVPAKQVHALNAAMLSGSLPVVKLLVQAGADPDLDDVFGKDANRYAKQLGRADLAEVLAHATVVQP